VSLLSTQSSSLCPLCGTAATRIHSHYQRRLTDLPSTGQPVRFLLEVRKFFCDESTCPRKIFTERLAPFVAPRARVTARLFQLDETHWSGDRWEARRARHRSHGYPDE
jgi:transposase